MGSIQYGCVSGVYFSKKGKPWEFFLDTFTFWLLGFYNAFHCYRFEEQEVPGSRSFFTEIIASISDIKFAKDGRHILSRDYMTLKVHIFYLLKLLYSWII